MTRIAIFGGSFNPPHVGHQALCLMLLETCPIDEVWVVPTYRHYFGKELVGYEDRARMCEHLIAPLGARARVSRVESELSEPQGRMLDTLCGLRTRHPDSEFRLVIGADILLETNCWHKWDAIEALAPPLVFERRGYEGGELPAPPDVSSTKIRARLALGASAVPWIPTSVQEHIDELGLYRS
ncbi:MAG: nicotinate-nicotinamide nucleotide adenylyltransferase [Myxococcales bacterium]|nr:nicotinate-nicotinamide nucleotide adenylyltransferase [Myxococcales bacterium]